MGNPTIKPRESQPSSFWRDSRTVRFYLLGIACLRVWICAYRLLRPVVANWWYARAQQQAIATWWQPAPTTPVPGR